MVRLVVADHVSCEIAGILQGALFRGHPLAVPWCAWVLPLIYGLAGRFNSSHTGLSVRWEGSVGEANNMWLGLSFLDKIFDVDLLRSSLSLSCMLTIFQCLLTAIEESVDDHSRSNPLICPFL